MKTLQLLLAGAPLIVSGCSPTAFAGSCSFEAPREASVAVQGASQIHIVARAGSLARDSSDTEH